MPRKVLHVVHYPEDDFGKWKVKEASTNTIVAQSDLKERAVQQAVFLAKLQMPSQVKIHGRDGKIQNEWTYKKDPRKYPS